MPVVCLKHTRMAGVAAAVPQQRQANSDLDFLTEAEKKQLTLSTGIHFRRIAPPEMTASDLCHAAAVRLLDELGWKPGEIDVLVMVTQTPDHLLPGNAILLQQRLGLRRDCLCYDLNQGCAGYVYGLSFIQSILAATGLRRGLLLVGDTITHLISAHDQSLVPIFSDAGSATAVEFTDAEQPAWFSLQSDGAGYQAIWVPGGAMRNPFTASSLVELEIKPGVSRAPVHLAMNGHEVFNFGLKEIAPHVQQLLDAVPVTTASVDYAVFHQANLLLNEAIRKKLDLPPEKVPYSLHPYGNTSSATIPVTLAECLGAALRSRSLQLLLCGFGVGLSWGSCYLTTHQIACPDVIEV